MLADLPDDARVPCARSRSVRIALVNRVKTLDEAIAQRQRAALRARRLRLHQLGTECRPAREGVEVGNLSINHLVASLAETPFGGVKDSGYGREGGSEGLTHYTVVKNVSHLTA